VSTLVIATRAWIKELETPPSQIARLKWEQAETAAASGANTRRREFFAQLGILGTVARTAAEQAISLVRDAMRVLAGKAVPRVRSINRRRPG
jgi:hypothetical protein